MNKRRSKETQILKLSEDTKQLINPELSLKTKNQKLKEHFKTVQLTISSMNAYSRMIRLQRNVYDFLLEMEDWAIIHAASERVCKAIRALKIPMPSAPPVTEGSIAE